MSACVFVRYLQVQALLKTIALIAAEAARLDKQAQERHRKKQQLSEDPSTAQQTPSKGVSLGSGADVILPILVYAAVHSGMKHPYVHVCIRA